MASATDKDRKLRILRDLNTTLQVHAERLKLAERSSKFVINPGSTWTASDQVEFFHTDNNVPDNTPLTSPRHAQSPTKRSRIPVSNKGLKAVNSAVLTQTKKNVKPNTSPARKRRLAREVVKSYKPGYTWNRGGRLKELRLRNLARKFSSIWKRRVFGRVLPSMADEIYRARVYRKVFNVLHDDWWTRRREWRLLVRAECHDRYRQCNKVWKSWRSFTQQQKYENQKWAWSVKLDSQRTLFKALCTWRIYTEERRAKSADLRTALHHYKSSIISNAFAIWYKHFEDSQILREKESQVTLAYELRSQNKCLMTWKRHFNLRKLQSEQWMLASKQSELFALRKTFNSWKEYHHIRKVKKQEYEQADIYYEDQVKQKFFTLWLARLKKLMDIKANEERCEELAARFRRRLAFNHWKHYIDLIKDDEEKMVGAENHHEHNLMGKCLGALKLCVVQRRLKIMREEKAVVFHDLNLQRSVWKQWIDKCDQREELKNYHLNQRALIHFRRKVLGRSLSYWQIFIEFRRTQKALEEKADVHYTFRLMTSIFHRWQTFIDWSHWKNQAEEAAAFQFRENMQAKYFYIWQSQFQLSQDVRTMDRMAILHQQEKMARYFLTKWRCKTMEKVSYQEKWEIAVAKHGQFLCREVISQWILIVRDRKADYNKEKRAVTHYGAKLLSKCFKAVKKYASNKQAKRLKIRKAEDFHSRCLLQPIFTSWLERTTYMKTCSKIADKRLQHSHHQLLSHIFGQWREVATSSRRLKEKVFFFRQSQNEKIAVKILNTWKLFAKDSTARKFADQEKTQALQEVISEIYKRSTFSKWVSARNRALMSHLKSVQASVHFHRKLISACMQQWRIHTRQMQQKKALEMKGCVTSKHRLMAKFFHCWKQEKRRAEVMNLKNRRALCHWSLILERKCLIAWFYYAEACKAKRERYAECMAQYREGLLLSGTRQWILVADHLGQMRKRLAVDRLAQDTHREMAAARRCFDHWRDCVLKRKTNTHYNSNPVPVILHGFCNVVTNSVDTESSLDTSPTRHSAIKYRSPPRSFQEPVLSQKSSPRVKPKSRSRAQPRQPSFLMESLEREGLLIAMSHEDDVHPAETCELPEDNSLQQNKAIRNLQEELDLPPPLSTNSAREKLASFQLSQEIMPPQAREIDTDSLVKRPFTPDRCPDLLGPDHFVAPVGQKTDELDAGVGEPISSQLLPPTAFTLHDMTNKRVEICPVKQCDYKSELESITSQLKNYRHKKRRLKQLNHQFAILSEWVGSQTEQLLDEESQCIYSEAKEGQSQLLQEIAAMTNSLTEEKEKCVLLADRLEELSHLVNN